MNSIKEVPKKKLALILCVLALACIFGGFVANTPYTVTLSGNMTTGYSWVYQAEPGGVITCTKADYTPGKSSSDGPVGADGEFTFTFEGISEVHVDVTFSYVRPWEDGVEPVETKVVKLDVDSRNNVSECTHK